MSGKPILKVSPLASAAQEALSPEDAPFRLVSYSACIHHVCYKCLSQPSLEAKIQQQRKEKLERIARVNEYRCELRPVFGQDLRNVVSTMMRKSVDKQSNWGCDGYINCMTARSEQSTWTQADALRRLLRSPEAYVDDLKDIINRYVCCQIPSAQFMDIIPGLCL